MTEYIASSELVGRRPRISRIRAYSSAFRPSSAHGWSRSASAEAIATVSRVPEAPELVGWAVDVERGAALVSGTAAIYRRITEGCLPVHQVSIRSVPASQ